MTYGFYGFDFSQNPLYSRLFNQDVMNKAQSAYQTGMSQFTPYDSRKEAGKKADDGTNGQNNNQGMTGNLVIGPDGRVYDISSADWLEKYTRFNTTPGGGFIDPLTGQSAGVGGMHGFDINQLWSDMATNKTNKDYLLKQQGWKAFGGK